MTSRFIKALDAFDLEKSHWVISQASGEGFFAWRKGEEADGLAWFTTEEDAEEYVLHRSVEAALEADALLCGLPVGVMLYWIGIAAAVAGLVLVIWMGARQW
jgi:hypothetical protein